VVERYGLVVLQQVDYLFLHGMYEAPAFAVAVQRHGVEFVAVELVKKVHVHSLADKEGDGGMSECSRVVRLFVR
jgi:hypothetical protein